MTPGTLSIRVVTSRLGWTREVLARIRSLPLGSFHAGVLSSDDGAILVRLAG
jgi:hypothetical protein